MIEEGEDLIQTKAATQAYQDGWDRIFGKNKKQVCKDHGCQFPDSPAFCCRYLAASEHA